ncbi:hypothetical protein LshimejAT787_0212070 [Lyophyllum shimeji]|uniref:Uncharacterized protein n=1 Tax=Lyophyllum shimeji TaxID=47721 RepID=A0A9P3PHT2_LYOSH|nr:hypothetical protein LshimejAT787_0212070 [Lyophyllum shimeji]
MRQINSRVRALRLHFYSLARPWQRRNLSCDRFQPLSHRRLSTVHCTCRAVFEFAHAHHCQRGKIRKLGYAKAQHAMLLACPYH